LNLVFLGPPGAGKGTQAAELAKRFGLAHISTGEILRDAIRRKTGDGQRAEHYLTSGALVPDDIVVGIVRERLSQPDCARGFILDGFPRTVAQARELDKILEKPGKPLQSVVYFEMPEEEVIRRLSNRRTCTACGAIYNLVFQPPPERDRCRCGGALEQRQDDAPETIRKRIRVYDEQTKPLIAYYRATGKLRTVDGSRRVEQVGDDLASVLGSLDRAKR
jgi:adenylate kinase